MQNDNKARQILNTSGPACLVVCVWLLGGTACTTSPYKRGDAASRGLITAAQAVQQENQAIRATVDALKELLAQPSDNLQFQTYASRLNTLEAAARRTQITGQALQQKSAAHLTAWDERLSEMTFEAVREKSQSRRDEVATALQSVQERYTATEQAVGPLIAYLQDIERALDADLTKDGLAAVQPIGENAQVNAHRLQVGLEALLQELQLLSAKLSSPVPDTEFALDPTKSRQGGNTAPSSARLSRQQ